MAARRRAGSFSPKTSCRLRVSKVDMLWDKGLSPLGIECGLEGSRHSGPSRRSFSAVSPRGVVHVRANERTALDLPQSPNPLAALATAKSLAAYAPCRSRRTTEVISCPEIHPSRLFPVF